MITLTTLDIGVLRAQSAEALLPQVALKRFWEAVFHDDYDVVYPTRFLDAQTVKLSRERLMGEMSEKTFTGPIEELHPLILTVLCAHYLEAANHEKRSALFEVEKLSLEIAAVLKGLILPVPYRRPATIAIAIAIVMGFRGEDDLRWAATIPYEPDFLDLLARAKREEIPIRTTLVKSRHSSPLQFAAAEM
jgi:hypothetical protein